MIIREKQLNNEKTEMEIKIAHLQKNKEGESFNKIVNEIESAQLTEINILKKQIEA